MTDRSESDPSGNPERLRSGGPDGGQPRRKRPADAGEGRGAPAGGRKGTERRAAGGAGRAGKPQGRLPRRKTDDEPGPRRLSLKWLTRGRDVLILQEPFCAQERAEDLDEVHAMIDAGEADIARDELLYLVSDCRAFFDAHNLLGRLAAEDGDLAVARGHYGFVYESVLRGLPHGFRGRLPAGADYNRAFFDGGHGLARVLVALDELSEAGRVLQRLSALDPDDVPTRELREEWEILNRPDAGSAGEAAPLVQLRLAPRPASPPDRP